MKRAFVAIALLTGVAFAAPMFPKKGVLVSDGNGNVDSMSLDANALRTMLVDANTNDTADVEGIRTNMVEIVRSDVVGIADTAVRADVFDTKNVRMGLGSSNLSEYGTAVGRATSTAGNSAALGVLARATGENATALGPRAAATAYASISVGNNAVSHGSNTFNVASEVGRWYAGNTPVIEAIRERFMPAEVTEVITNGAPVPPALGASQSVVTNRYVVYVPDGSGVKTAYEDSASLAAMLDDASTNATSRSSAGAKVMSLIDPQVTSKINESVSSQLNTYVDGETGVEYVGTFYGGSFYYVPTGNVYPPNE